jgi:hypothetical protein
MEVSVSTNESNNCSVSELNYIRESVENMSKFNQVEILKILKKYNDITLNENKYGIHINITDIRKEILDEIVVYINYVNTQEISLNNVEKQKIDYKNTYFSKDIKDK